jgi:hypothetical protein
VFRGQNFLNPYNWQLLKVSSEIADAASADAQALRRDGLIFLRFLNQTAGDLTYE